MRVNVPLLPIAIDVRVRRLTPFRATLLRMMIAVACSGLLFGLWARLGQLNRALTRSHETVRELRLAGKDLNDPVANRQSHRYFAIKSAYEWTDFLTFLVMATSGFLGGVAILGRALDLLLRQLATTDAPRSSPTLGLHTEGLRP